MYKKKKQTENILIKFRLLKTCKPCATAPELSNSGYGTRRAPLKTVFGELDSLTKY